jgi:hypothetical protein
VNVLSICDLTANMVRPWTDAGHTATIVDIQHQVGERKEDRLTVVGADLLEWKPEESYDIVFAFPPCTHLANSGARWFRDKGLKALIEALTLVERCREICEEQINAPYMIENSVGQLSTYWRLPNYYFDPCDYGDPYTKKTALWTGNGFRMPTKDRVEPTLGSKMHYVSPGPDRSNIRSETPMGFARAVYEANKPVAPTPVSRWKPRPGPGVGRW